MLGEEYRTAIYSAIQGARSIVISLRGDQRHFEIDYLLLLRGR